MKRPAYFARLLTAPVFTAVAPAAFALCSGFTDVDAASTFCPNVDWLRNREITLGCTSTTLFCPSTPVTRLQMAAFMNRLGTALTPTLVYQDGGAASLDLTTSPTICATAEIAPKSYSRSASVAAVLTTLAGATTGIQMQVATSTDGGTTWLPATVLPQRISGTGTSRWINAAAWKGDIALDAGVPYRFALRVSPQVGTAALGTWSCQVKGIVASRTGTGPPY